MKAEEEIEEIWKMFRDTDRKMAQTDRKMAESDRKMAELREEHAKTERIPQRTLQQLGDLGNRLGEFVEYSIKPALVRLFRERGIDVEEVQRDISRRRDGMATQIDMLVLDDNDCVVVEVKSKLTVEDINIHLERMEKFKELFPRYENLRVMGAVAGTVVPDDVAKYAARKGFFVIVPRGEDVELFNSEDFEPATW
jgi:hypothetical protein